MNSIKNNFTSIEQMSHELGSVKKGNNSNQTSNSQVSFFDILQKTQSEAACNDELRFSKHANERLSSRNIDMTQSQVERLKAGTQKAREKGINESLVCVDELAFIVNVKNNTVITALNSEEDKVFTNIDGAVIV